ncbi:MAG: alpha/beta hydrolase [Desulfohalobiaceae bacterium]|nr:alpha/beta hydrolase [Desulfohalobiaceae bacterium]
MIPGKKFRLNKKLVAFLSILLLGILSLLCFGAYKIYSTLDRVIYHTSRGDIPSTTPGRYDLQYRDIEFESSGGLLLKGWYIPGGTDDCVILAPGKGSNRWDVLPYAPFLHKAGYDVLLFDPQSTGLSQGDQYAFGYYESRNLLRAVDYLQSRHNPEDIALLGRSAGGTASILAALEDPRITAVIADSPFANLRKAAANYEAPHKKFMFRAVFRLYTLGAEIMLGFDVGSKLDLTSKIHNLSQPLFLIHGTEDRIIHPSNSRLLYSLAPGPKELWLVPETGHIQSFSRKPGVCKRKILSFLDRHLRKRPPVSARAPNKPDAGTLAGPWEADSQRHRPPDYSAAPSISCVSLLTCNWWTQRTQSSTPSMSRMYSSSAQTPQSSHFFCILSSLQGPGPSGSGPVIRPIPQTRKSRPLSAPPRPSQSPA